MSSKRETQPDYEISLRVGRLLPLPQPSRYLRTQHLALLLHAMVEVNEIYCHMVIDLVYITNIYV